MIAHSMPEISVVIPTFNRARYLGRAIGSVLGQTFPPRQVIVVDDGSTDNTAEVCQSFVGQIEYVRQVNAGASAARNMGIQLAIHPWVAFLDSDDYWAPFHLRNMVAAINGTGEKGCFYFCDMQLSSEEGGGTVWELIGFHPPGPFHLTPDATAWMFMRRQPTMLQCCVFNKQSLNEAGGLLKQFRLMHDSELFFRLGIGASVCAVGGVGCIQTADAHSSGRLTGVVAEGSKQHLVEQLLLWSSVLDGFPKMESDYRRLVRTNVAGSYWRLSRFYWRTGDLYRSLLNFLWAGARDPGFLVWLILKRSSKGYGEGRRPGFATWVTTGHPDSSV